MKLATLIVGLLMFLMFAGFLNRVVNHAGGAAVVALGFSSVVSALLFVALVVVGVMG